MAGWRRVAHAVLAAGIVAATGLGVLAGATAPAAALGGVATISGTVTDTAGAPIGFTCVEAQNETYNYAQTSTDSAGAYTLNLSAAGSYRITFGCWNGDWIRETYDDHTDVYGFGGGDKVVVNAGDAVTGIDAALVRGASASGRIADTNGNPVGNAYVSFSGTDQSGGSAQSASDGTYTVRGLRPGSYLVQASSYATGQGGFWHGTDYSDAERLLVGAGRSYAGIDITFAIPGSISGHVSDEAGNPLVGECVYALGQQAYGIYGSANTDSVGDYHMTGMKPGSYRIGFNTCGSDTTSAFEFYGDTIDIKSATWVPVTAGQDTPGIDAQLARGGAITGTVANQAGEPQAGVCVGANRPYVASEGPSTGNRWTRAGADGTYRIDGLVAADFEVVAYNCSGLNNSEYLTQFYGGTPGVVGGDNAGTLVHPALGADTTGIDFTLAKGGFIEGTVTGAGSPLAGVCLAAVTDVGAYQQASANSGTDGHYRMGPLAAADYKVAFATCGPDLQQYAPEWYHDALQQSDATPVDMALGQTTTVNEDLSPGGSISGKVVGEDGKAVPAACGGAHLVGVTSPPQGDVVYGDRWATVQADGTYTIGQLVAGTYEVSLGECYTPYRYRRATQTVTITGGQAQGGVDFSLVRERPSVFGISPASAAEGDAISVVGRNLDNITEVRFGDAASPSIAKVSNDEIDAVVPPGALGSSVQVTAVSAAGVSDAFTFTYGTPSPTVSALSPSSGPTSGGTSVTITGSHLADATAVSFGSQAAVFTVVDDFTITATSPAAVNGTPGAVPVSVTTPEGVAAGPSFTYVVPPPPPYVNWVSPSSGPAAGGTTVQIVGGYFTGATGVAFGGVPAASFTVVDDWTISAVTPAGTAGSAVAVEVTTPSGTSCCATFTYDYPPKPPEVGSVSPAEGPEAGGTSVTISGVRFSDADGVTFGGVPASSFTVINDWTITATSPGGTGVVDVAVHSPAGTSDPAAYDDFEYRAVPVVSSLSPASGTTAGGTSVVISGGDFRGASAVSFGGTSASSFTVDSASQITALSPAGAAGAVGVTVTTAGGTSEASAAAAQYTYQKPPPPSAPDITGVSPARGGVAGGDVLTVSGHHFTGATGATVGGLAAAFTVVDDSTVAVTTPAHASGTVSVTVTTAAGTATAPNAFRYVGAPLVTGVSPASGPKGGGTVVTLSGVDLVDVQSVVLVEKVERKRLALSFTELADGTVRITMPAHHPGLVGIEVRTKYGVSPSSAAGFTYTK